MPPLPASVSRVARGPCPRGGTLLRRFVPVAPSLLTVTSCGFRRTGARDHGTAASRIWHDSPVAATRWG